MNYYAFSSSLSMSTNSEWVVLTWKQFELFQSWTSGSLLGETEEECVSYFSSRGDRLHSEALQYEEEGHGYVLPMGYCPYGTEKIDNSCFYWYQTTSGTTLACGFDQTESLYQVSIPPSRKGGYHDGILQAILKGITQETLDRIINSHNHEELCEEEYSKLHDLFPELLPETWKERQERILARKEKNRLFFEEAEGLPPECVEYDEYDECEEYDEYDE